MGAGVGKNFADIDSGPKSQANTRQQAMVMDKRSHFPSKTLKEGRKGEWQCAGKVEASFSDRTLDLINGIRINFRAISIVV